MSGKGHFECHNIEQIKEAILQLMDKDAKEIWLCMANQSYHNLDENKWKRDVGEVVKKKIDIEKFEESDQELIDVFCSMHQYCAINSNFINIPIFYIVTEFPDLLCDDF